MLMHFIIAIVAVSLILLTAWVYYGKKAEDILHKQGIYELELVKGFEASISELGTIDLYGISEDGNSDCAVAEAIQYIKLEPEMYSVLSRDSGV